MGTAIRLPWAASALVFLGGVACGSDSGSQADAAATNIGPTGGSVVIAEGAGVVVPAGALSEETTITVAVDTTSPLPTGTTVVGQSFLFGPEGQQFQVPVEVTIPFNPALLPVGTTAANVTIYTAPVGTTGYESLVTTVVDSIHVKASTTHFSVFVAGVADGLGCEATGGGSACDDGNSCTHTDTCGESACAGTAYACNDQDPCTTDFCDGDGGCGTQPLCAEGLVCEGGVCIDPNVCIPTGDEVCGNGTDEDCDGNVTNGCTGWPCTGNPDCASGYGCVIPSDVSSGTCQPAAPAG